jgi:hypothetical protein
MSFGQDILATLICFSEKRRCLKVYPIFDLEKLMKKTLKIF